MLAFGALLMPLKVSLLTCTDVVYLYIICSLGDSTPRPPFLCALISFLQKSLISRVIIHFLVSCMSVPAPLYQLWNPVTLLCECATFSEFLAELAGLLEQKHNRGRQTRTNIATSLLHAVTILKTLWQYCLNIITRQKSKTGPTEGRIG